MQEIGTPLSLPFVFSFPVFIYGIGGNYKSKPVLSLLSFLLGIAKLAIYKTRKAKLKGKNVNVLLCFKGMISARVKMEQAYLLSLDIVGDQWYTDEVLSFFS